MLPDTATAAEAIALVRQRGYSRIPIFSQRETNVIGVVTAMDLLRRGGQVRGVSELMRQPTFVPQTKRIDDLLREMQKGRNPLAVVVDEYGGATGIVTVEDIVEQIVGEIQDEHDRTPASVERLPDGSYWVAARTHIDEVNEALDWNLPKLGFETVAGLVLATLHRIPRTGEELQIPGYTITVLEADARRVAAVKIAPSNAPAPSAGAA
jgi:CBS domain containing-hemolysin-like protein